MFVVECYNNCSGQILRFCSNLNDVLSVLRTYTTSGYDNTQNLFLSPMNPAVVPVETLNESERNVTSLADERLLARVLSHMRFEQARPLEHFVAVRATDGFFLILRTVCIIEQSMVQLHVVL